MKSLPGTRKTGGLAFSVGDTIYNRGLRLVVSKTTRIDDTK